MARYTGPNNKQSRRVGFSVLESGVEFAKGKKRTYGPGQHGASRKRKPSNYSIQLTEKQKENLALISQIINRYDLVLSGHLHNGYRRLETIIRNPEKYMDEGYWEMGVEKDINGNISFIRPWIYKKTDLCRGVIYVGDGEERIIELSNGKFYYKKNEKSTPVQLTEKQVEELRNMIPIVISGGVNKFFNIPIDKSEITQVKVLKR